MCDGEEHGLGAMWPPCPHLIEILSCGLTLCACSAICKVGESGQLAHGAAVGLLSRGAGRWAGLLPC